MKRHCKKSYLYYFRKHFFIMLAVWVVLCYLILEGLYFYLFSRIEQKTATNFYEGMENIQYVVKDMSLEEGQTEIMYALGNMSNAGNYALPSDDLPSYYYPGSILGLRLDAMDLFLDISATGRASDGNGNTYLNGNGRGYGFIEDAETGEVICGPLGVKNEHILFLMNEEAPSSLAWTVIFYPARDNLIRCEHEKLRPVFEILSDITETQWEKLKAENPEADKGMRLQWIMDTFYLKGDEFYPAKVSLYYRSVNFVGTGDTKFQNEFVTDYSFEAPGDGYSLYLPDPEKERVVALFLNSSPDEVNTFHTWKPDEAFQSEAKNAINTMKTKGRKSDLGGSWSVGNPLLYFINGKMVFARYAYFVDAAGHSYRACTYETITDLFMGNRYDILLWSFILLFWLIILALITSYFEYARKRYQFMTEEYRRTLMDSMAHDLKSPLMAISGYAENLSEHINDEKREHYAREILGSVEYMNSLVMRNLEILRLDGRKKKMIQEEVDIKALFEKAVSQYEGSIETKKLQIKMEGEMKKKGDAELLWKVADNLMGNAVAYSPEGGTITMMFNRQTITISNQTDLKYDKKMLKQLWEPFVRGEESRNGKGTGLGLSIVAAVLDRHKWNYKLSYDEEAKQFSCIIKIPVGIIL